nr:DUF397 domain-containing protein [Micromonospora sp. DSM 115978]
MELTSATPAWRVSSRSANSSSCVEVADNLPDRVLVRDSKDRTGPALTFDPAPWSAFIHTVTNHHP